jgi:hypothetical protein
MTSGAVITLNLISCEKASPKEESVSWIGLINETCFDKLFATVFDSMEAMHLLSQNDLPAMLHTIACISAAR